MNRLRKAVRDYLTMRRGLGFKMLRHAAGLREFVSFLARKRSARITVNLALEWATQDAHHTPGEWAVRLSIVRGFARHWSATDPLTEVPPLGLLPYRPKRAQPYFYSDHEIRTLLKAAKKVLADYAKRRDERFGVHAEGHFLVNLNGNRLDKGEVHRAFYILSRQIGLRAVDASRGPRLHDFRHRFAVETLLRWYRNGEDPKRRLPLLSTYLGHAHVTDTYWYLTGTPELLGAAAKRLEKRWEGLNAGSR
jgi:hypothetical protein